MSRTHLIDSMKHSFRASLAIAITCFLVAAATAAPPATMVDGSSEASSTQQPEEIAPGEQIDGPSFGSYAPRTTPELEPQVMSGHAYPKQASRCAPHGCGHSPAAPHNIWSVDSARGCGPCGKQVELGWDSRCIGDWQHYAQGEYIGPARSAHVDEYRLRVDDELGVFFLRSREVINSPYELQVGDRVLVESLTAGSSAGLNPNQTQPGGAGDNINREVIVQPDGMITLPLIGRVVAAGRRIEALHGDLESRYEEFYNVPSITVTPVQVNTRLEDLMDTVDSRGGQLGGRRISATVTPAGKIQLPGLGGVYLQGLTLSEAKKEIDARYASKIPGVSVSVDLTERAPRFVYVLGQVQTPGRFELNGPTSTMQAIALAGGWQVGSNLRQVIVFRRGRRLAPYGHDA